MILINSCCLFPTHLLDLELILNTKYHDIREIVNKKLEEFFLSLDHLIENPIENTEIPNANNDDVQMQDASKVPQNGELRNSLPLQDQEEIINNSKIYLSTSQIMTKILLGK